MTITDAAKEILAPIMGEQPGKILRIVFEGFG
jgi:hypothetical protein